MHRGRWRGGKVVGGRVEGVKTDTEKKKRATERAREKTDRSINLPELTGYKKMFTSSG